jgi:RNA polymerase sigma factor for flagellar operon FliA
VSDPAVAKRVAELTAEIIPQARAEAYKVWQRAPHALELDELESLALGGLASASARWEKYCDERGHDPTAYEYFPAYCLRRMRGAMMDWLRTQDWVTRSARTRAKALRDAGQDRGLSEDELSAATGLTVTEIRDTLTAVAARPVSLDAEPHDLAGSADVEGSAVVSQVLGAVVAVMARLPRPSREILVLRYYHGQSLDQAASVVGVTAEEGAALYATAVLAVHDEMMKAVQ